MFRWIKKKIDEFCDKEIESAYKVIDTYVRAQTLSVLAQIAQNFYTNYYFSMAEEKMIKEYMEYMRYRRAKKRTKKRIKVKKPRIVNLQPAFPMFFEIRKI